VNLWPCAYTRCIRVEFIAAVGCVARPEADDILEYALCCRLRFVDRPLWWPALAVTQLVWILTSCTDCCVVAVLGVLLI
jgi:hypothetical protein